MGHSNSKPTTLHLPQALANSASLPHRLVASYAANKKSVLLSDPDTPPRQRPEHAYTLTLNDGWHGALTMVYGGPDNTEPDAPLATARPAGRMRLDYAITLPPPPSESVDEHPQRGGGAQLGEVVLRYSASLRREAYRFAIEVGCGPDARPIIERFEWRRSHGAEVNGVEGGGGWGWKLVRIGNDSNVKAKNANVELTTEDEGEGLSGGWTSDGKEVVAMWANTGDTTLSKVDSKADSKVGMLEFRGSGATGELGPVWSVMAAVSATCIWVKRMQTTTRTGAVLWCDAS
jgi:hypothetical protein